MELLFELQGEEYIELNKLLKTMNLVSTGGEANYLISDGLVKVNDLTETRKRNKIRSGDKVDCAGNVIKVI